MERDELVAMVNTIKSWCELLAIGAQREAKYDGFGRNSFHKSHAGLAANYKQQLASIADYKRFIDQHVAGHKGW
ncbi:hypothetical protein [Burkholderia sp. 9120]|uniref:hypothetical protein n=1 Tax=Burkholderia sp. 9120 TaxID=1500897 RepID=UPI000553BD03|nr:hypothetical protein [Burkholderia sp. 9120]